MNISRGGSVFGTGSRSSGAGTGDSRSGGLGQKGAARNLVSFRPGRLENPERTHEGRGARREVTAHWQAGGLQGGPRGCSKTA